MTQLDDRRYCDWLHGCVKQEHNNITCYWRYVDECLDQGMSEWQMLRQSEWRTRTQSPDVQNGLSPWRVDESQDNEGVA